MQTMLAAGADRIWAEDSGGGRPPLVLLHEHVADSRMWDPVWPELTRAFRVIRYDVRGFGRSPGATEPFSLQADLNAVLGHFGIARAHVAGCSGGAGMAVELALGQPDRVASLVLLSPGLPGYDWPAEPELDAEYDALAAAGDTDGITRLYLRIYAMAGPDPLVAELARSAALAQPSEKFQQPGAKVFGRLGELRAPAAIMIGDRDRPVLMQCAADAAARIPGCALVIMPGSDHYPTVRDPQLVLATILRHCGRPRSGPGTAAGGPR